MRSYFCSKFAFFFITYFLTDVPLVNVLEPQILSAQNLQSGDAFIDRLFHPLSMTLLASIRESAASLRSTEVSLALGFGFTMTYLSAAGSVLVPSLHPDAVFADASDILFSGNPLAFPSATPNCITYRWPHFWRSDDASPVIAKLQIYSPQGSVLKARALDIAKKLNHKDGQRSSEGVDGLEAFARSFMVQSRLAGEETNARAMFTRRIEATVGVSAADEASLIAAAKAALRDTCNQVFNRPLETLTDDSQNMLELFRCKLRFWSIVARVLQSSTELGSDISPAQKKSCLKFVASQLSLLIRGDSSGLSARDLKCQQSLLRQAAYLPPGRFPPAVVAWLRLRGVDEARRFDAAVDESVLAHTQAVAGGVGAVDAPAQPAAIVRRSARRRAD
jgi:hypothetical protein